MDVSTKRQKRQIGRGACLYKERAPCATTEELFSKIGKRGQDVDVSTKQENTKYVLCHIGEEHKMWMSPQRDKTTKMRFLFYVGQEPKMLMSLHR